MKILFRTNAPGRLEPISRKKPKGLQENARLYCSAFAGREIKIEQSQKNWRTIDGLDRPGEDALGIEPMRPLPQNNVSCLPAVVVDADAGVLDEEDAVLVSWLSSAGPRSVAASGWPASEPGYC